MDSKLDIRSTTIEKGIELVRDFVGKLVSPSMEELGLLMRDRVSLWRLKNQVDILNKAKRLCEERGISPKAVPARLLCPYLENASLEDDELVQDKWATLLANMVDTNQNIQNHVFPYILSQLSREEFLFLEAVVQERKRRLNSLTKDLEVMCAQKGARESDLKSKIESINVEIDALVKLTGKRYGGDVLELEAKRRSVERELQLLGFEEFRIRAEIIEPDEIPEEGLGEIELSNVIRLGLVKVEFASSAGRHEIEIPQDQYKEYVYAKLDIEIENVRTIVLTGLGERLIEACSNPDCGAEKPV